MIGIIDTSSLLAIARYYLSIKDEVKLLNYIESKFRSGDLILLGTIHFEVSHTNKGSAINAMKFLDEKALRYDDTFLKAPAPRVFSNQLDNNLCITLLKKNLSSEEYLQQKAAYLETGDAKMILYALNNMALDPVIITEESKYNNDGKLFKKLPAICDFLGIKHMSITEWLGTNGVELSWSHP